MNTSKKNPNLQSHDEFLDEHRGKKGTPGRDEYEAGFEAFKLGAMLRIAREEKGLTQEKLAELIGTNKSYISKVENDINNVRFSTLYRIITQGLGGKLEISIKL